MIPMTYRFAFLLFFIGFLLQSTVMRHLAIFGYSPNLLLCLVVVLSFLMPDETALVLGVIFGFLQDVLFSEIVGVTALAFLLIAALVRELKRYLYREHLLSLITITLTGTILHAFVVWGIMAMFGSNLSIAPVALSLTVLIPYQFAVVWVMHRFLVKKMRYYRAYQY